jgi:MASE1
MPWSRHRPVISLHKRRLLTYLTLALAYVLTGRLGLLLAVPPGYATAIFPPAGIAVAAAFIGGRRTLPWIFAGSCALNLWIGSIVEQHIVARALAVAVLIATASAAQAAVGGWALRKLIDYPAALDNVKDLGKFLLAAPVLCLTSATLSHSGMAAFGVIDTSEVASSWLSWWSATPLASCFSCRLSWWRPVSRVPFGAAARDLSRYRCFCSSPSSWRFLFAPENGSAISPSPSSNFCRRGSPISCNSNWRRKKTFSANSVRFGTDRRGCCQRISPYSPATSCSGFRRYRQSNGHRR